MKSTVQGKVDLAYQIRHKHEGAPQYADQQGLPPRVVPVDLGGDLRHPPVQLLLGKEHPLHVLVQHVFHTSPSLFFQNNSS